MSEVEALLEIARAVRTVAWAFISFISILLGMWLDGRRRP